MTLRVNRLLHKLLRLLWRVIRADKAACIVEQELLRRLRPLANVPFLAFARVGDPLLRRAEASRKASASK